MSQYKKEDIKDFDKNDGSKLILRRKIKNHKNQKISNQRKYILPDKINNISSNDTFYYSTRGTFAGISFATSNKMKSSGLNDKSFYSINKLNKFPENNGFKEIKNYGSTKALQTQYNQYNNNSIFISGSRDIPYSNQNICEKYNTYNFNNNDIKPRRKQTAILYKRRDDSKKENHLIKYSILTSDNKSEVYNDNINNYKFNSITYRKFSEVKKDINANNKSSINYDNQLYNKTGNAFTYVIKKKGSRFKTDDDFSSKLKNGKNYDNELYNSKLKKNGIKEKKYRMTSLNNSSFVKNFFFNPLKNNLNNYEYSSNTNNNINKEKEKRRQDNNSQILKNSKSYIGLRIKTDNKNKINDSKVNYRERRRNELDNKTERKTVNLTKKNIIRIGVKKEKKNGEKINCTNNKVNIPNKSNINKDEIKILLKNLMDRKEKYNTYNKEKKEEIEKKNNSQNSEKKSDNSINENENKKEKEKEEITKKDEEINGEKENSESKEEEEAKDIIIKNENNNNSKEEKEKSEEVKVEEQKENKNKEEKEKSNEESVEEQKENKNKEENIKEENIGSDKKNEQLLEQDNLKKENEEENIESTDEHLNKEENIDEKKKIESENKDNELQYKEKEENDFKDDKSETKEIKIEDEEKKENTVKNNSDEEEVKINKDEENGITNITKDEKNENEEEEKKEDNLQEQIPEDEQKIKNEENEEKIENNKIENDINKEADDIKEIKDNNKEKKLNSEINNLEKLKEKIEEVQKYKINKNELKSNFIPPKLNTFKATQFKTQKEIESGQRKPKKMLRICLPSNNKKNVIIYNNPDDKKDKNSKVIYYYTSSSDMNENIRRHLSNLTDSYESDNKYKYTEDDRQSINSNSTTNQLNNHNYLETKHIKNAKKNIPVTMRSEGKHLDEYNNNNSNNNNIGYTESTSEIFKPYVSKYPEKVFKKRGLAFKNYKIKISNKKGSKNKTIIFVKNNNVNEDKNQKIQENEKPKNTEEKKKYSSYFGDSNNNVYFEINASNKKENINIKEKESSSKFLNKRRNISNLQNYNSFGVQNEALCIPNEI